MNDTTDLILCVGGATEHTRVVQDEFAKLPGVRRAMPGDCYCQACKQNLPAWWNGGKPVPVSECKD